MFLLKKVPSYYLYTENTIIIVQFQDRKTMDIVEEDLEYLFWDKEGTSLVKNKSGVAKRDTGDLYYPWSDNKLYKCT